MPKSSILGSSDDGAPHTVLQPPGWPQPKGFANGIRARGEMVFVGGMIGQDKDGRFAAGCGGQMKRPLEIVAAVWPQGGPPPRHFLRLPWSLRDMDDFLPLF